MKTIQQVIVAAAIAGTLFSASAQTTNVILQTDFDGDAGEGNYSFAYGYCVAGTSAGSSATGFSGGGVQAGIGVGGTSANYISPDYSQLPEDPDWTNPDITYAYAVVGLATGFSAPISTITPTNASSFVLSADLQVQGLETNLPNTDVSISKLQFIDGDGNILFDFVGDAGYAGSNFVHISVPLSSLNNASDAMYPVSDLTNADIVASISSFVVEFSINGLVGNVGGAQLVSPPFGFSNTGELIADNIQLNQVIGSAVPIPTVERLIWQADFDTTFPNDGDYGFNDRDGSPNATGSWAINSTNGVGDSASFGYTVDFSSWIASPPVSYSGFGLGADESPLPYTLTSSSKASYRVYLSTKVGGTSAGITNVPGQVDLSFFIPNGTEVYDLTAPFAFSTNWQSFVFDGATNLQVATWLTGAQAMFDQNVTNVNKIELQLSAQGSPDVGALFGHGTNAIMNIDNIKVVELVPGLAPVAIIQTGGQSRVVWTDPSTGGTAQLQSATNVAGPYINVTGASSATEASPYVVPSGSNRQFFRTVWVP
ncbi:MAG TPA: hypothetical protein VMH87_02430 [Pseudomonadales bacterium]|nr:hypothetical protein [Pseudomonadales bacterium]